MKSRREKEGDAVTAMLRRQNDEQRGCQAIKGDMVGVMEMYGEVVDGSHGLRFSKEFFHGQNCFDFFSFLDASKSQMIP